MFNTQMLADMRQQNIKEVNADDLVDIRTVSVDTSLPPEQRMMNYLEQVKNPSLQRTARKFGSAENINDFLKRTDTM